VLTTVFTMYLPDELGGCTPMTTHCAETDVTPTPLPSPIGAWPSQHAQLATAVALQAPARPAPRKPPRWCGICRGKWPYLCPSWQVRGKAVNGWTICEIYSFTKSICHMARTALPSTPTARTSQGRTVWTRSPRRGMAARITFCQRAGRPDPTGYHFGSLCSRSKMQVQNAPLAMAVGVSVLATTPTGQQRTRDPKRLGLIALSQKGTSLSRRERW
jgi:hypothetical protein